MNAPNPALAPDIVRERMVSAEGREAIIASMLLPVKRELDARNLALRCFAPFPKDEPHVDAEDLWVTNEVTPELAIDKYVRSRHNEAQRLQDLAVIGLYSTVVGVMIEEFDHMGVEGPVTPVEGGHILVNAREFADFRKLTPQQGFEMETRREMLRAGLMGCYKGANVLVSRLVPVGTMYSISKPEDLGCYADELAMQTREDLGESKKVFAFDASLKTWLRLHDDGQVMISKIIPATPDRHRSIPFAE